MGDKKVRMGVISGASLALKLKDEKRNVSNEDIVQEITRDMDEILDKIDKSL